VKGGQKGAIALEYLILLTGVLVPATFSIIFTSELLWVWHSGIEFTRDGARYAATHCWQGAGDNVRAYMQEHVPLTVDRQQFQNAGSDVIVIEYFARDAETGELAEFSCDGECSTSCVPDVVSVRIQNYEFRHAFLSYLGLPSVPMPEFRTTLPMESAGCDPEQGQCFP